MVPSAETATQAPPTIPESPSGGTATLPPRETTPVIGGPGGGPPRPPKRPTGGGGGGGGNGDGPSGPGDDAARKRLTLIVAAGGIVILIIMFVLLHNSGTDTATETTPTGLPVATQSLAKAAAASTQPTTPAASSPTASSPAPTGPVLKAGSVTKIKVKQGQTVAFQVTSPTAQEVHVHGYDKKYELAAGQTLAVSFPATISGIFDIEFEFTSTQIGELTVEP